MFLTLFKSKWTNHVISYASASAGSVTVSLRGLVCLKHLSTGQIKFREDTGMYFVEWITKKWREEGNSTLRMISGSPWRWRVELQDTEPFNIKLKYNTDDGIEQMFSDTLDALIKILEANKD